MRLAFFRTALVGLPPAAGSRVPRRALPLASLMSLAFAAACVGCGGQYEITLPEQVMPAGQDSTVVVRIQKSEIGDLMPAAGDMPVWVRVENGRIRGAITDKGGYAAVSVKAPSQPGKYHVTVGVADKDGKQAEVFAPLWAMDPYLPMVVVDMECLPPLGKSQGAAEALARVAETSSILYVTVRPESQRQRSHELLAAAGYPEGPISTWQRGVVHVSGAQVLLEDRLVSLLPTLRKQFARFAIGVTDGQLGAEAMTRAGLNCIVVTPAKMGEHYPKGVVERSWAEIAKGGLPFAVATSGPAGTTSSQPGDEATSQPTSGPTTEPATESTTQPASKPAEEGTSQPVDETSSKPAEETTRPSDEASSKPAEETNPKPTQEPATLPADEPSSKPVIESSMAPGETAASTPSQEASTKPADTAAPLPAQEASSQPQDER